MVLIDIQLATMGGAKILGLQDKIGNFDPGKDFDALILDPLASGSNFDTFDVSFSDISCMVRGQFHRSDFYFPV